MLAKHWQRWKNVGKFADVLPTLPTDGQHWPDLACLLGSLLEIEDHVHPQNIFFNLLFWDPHNLQLQNFVVCNEKFCPLGSFR